jgi:GNAT superfamily N-acetyltransferase
MTMLAEQARPNIGLRPARFPGEIEAVRAILRDYEAATAVRACFAGFERELAGLPGAYAGPAGALIVAGDGAADLAGCVGLRPVEDGAEIKRLFVRPSARGQGLGGALVDAVIEAARAAGHRRVVLETHESMTAAAALYLARGFVPGSWNAAGIRIMTRSI